MGTIAETLGAFVAQTHSTDLPVLALERAKMSLVSTLASAAVGFGIESARQVRHLEQALGANQVQASGLETDVCLSTVLHASMRWRVTLLHQMTAICVALRILEPLQQRWVWRWARGFIHRVKIF